MDQGSDGIKLVLTDNQMGSGITGYEIMQKYSQRNGFKEIPFILLTGDYLGSFSFEDFPESKFLSKNSSPLSNTEYIKKILESKESSQ